MATECTQESVLDFMLDNGGRVKNKALVEHFKVCLNSESTSRAQMKERFKRFVDNIAYVKQENGEKVVCLKKKYREPGARGGGAQGDDVVDGDGGGRTGAASLDAASPPPTPETPELCVSHIVLEEDNPPPLSPDSQAPEDEKKAEEPKSSGTPEPAEPSAEAGVFKAPSQVIRRRASRGSQRSLQGSSEDGDTGSRRNLLELMLSASHVRRGSRKSGSAEEDCWTTLDPLEHEWMMCAADGQWDSLQRLLECDPTLVSKKDFVTGFTCLHWAAKQGKHELFALLMAFAKQHQVAANVNGRSSAGYTPLHLAAMHNHGEVMKLLVGAYDADVEVRDYSGRKACHYLPLSVSGDLKDVVGACVDQDTENPPGTGRWRLPRVSDLNPLRLLNPPDEEPRTRPLSRKSSLGRIRLQRSRFRTQIVHSTSFREKEERESLQSPARARPLSDLFG